MTTTLTCPPPALMAGDLLDLVRRSQEALCEACSASTTSERYAQAHLAALRAAAALLSQVAPRTVGSRPRSAWEAMARHVPEFGEWASFFTTCAPRARAAQSGLTTIGAREADDLVRQSELFLDAVSRRVGLPACVSVAGRLTPVHVG